jgi:hypothetical protein
VRIFLDASMLLAAAGSAAGGSRAVFDYAPAHRWTLVSSPWAVNEVVHNLPDLALAATGDWLCLRPCLLIVDDVLVLDRPVVFAASKDRPILFTALASADVLLTLDRVDFGGLLGGAFYGLRVRTPYAFLQEERKAGRLSPF